MRFDTWLRLSSYVIVGGPVSAQGPDRAEEGFFLSSAFDQRETKATK